MNTARLLVPIFILQEFLYLLLDFYWQAILTKEIADQIEKERLRREKRLGRDERPGKVLPEVKVFTEFTALKITQKYKDPIRQAEYAYSKIRNEVSS